MSIGSGAGQVSAPAVFVGEHPQLAGCEYPAEPEHNDGLADLFVSAVPGVFASRSVRDDQVEGLFWKMIEDGLSDEGGRQRQLVRAVVEVSHGTLGV